MSRRRLAPPSPRAARPTRSGVGRTLYHGTALLHVEPKGGPKGSAAGRGRRAALGILSAVLAIALLGGVASVAWRLRAPLARAVAGLHLGRARVVVGGTEYLSAAEVLQAAGLHETESFFGVNLERARKRLLRHPRVREALVERRLNGELHVQVGERVPLVVVHLGRLAEVDAEGRVLPPLVGGETPDLPVVTGLSAPVGGWVRDPRLARAVRWVKALGAPEVGLASRVSEVDVGSPTESRIVMSPTGARVLLPPEPDDVEQLSAVRVVLADLEAKGQQAALIDCRARGQAVVQAVERPAAPTKA